MAYKSEYLGQLFSLLERLPNETWFDHCVRNGKPWLQFQANSLSIVRTIRAAFPGTVWRKEYEKACSWWSYTTEYQGWIINIYACYEAPKSCKPILKKRVVKTEVPLTTEIVEEEEEVIIGWNCGEFVVGNEQE